MASFKCCVKQESQRVYNIGQSKLQKVTRDIVDPKALRCFNLGKCIPDIFQLNCLESELSPIFVKSP